MIGLKIIDVAVTNAGKITPESLSADFQIAPKQSLEILKYGSQLGIFIELFNSHNPMKSEFCVKEIILNKREAGYDVPEIDEFTEFVERFHGEIKDNFKYVTLEVAELKEEVITALASRQRQKATELIVDRFQRENFVFTTRDDLKSEMWIYKDGIYLPQGKSFVREFCRLVLGSAYTRQFVNEVIEKIETDTFVDSDQFFSNNYPFEVPIIDGILHILERKVYPFSPRKIFFNKLPLKYDPDAKCPKITEHFETVLRERDDVKVMFELFGYCLLKENKFEKAFMFVGEESGGKSKTLQLLKNFIGIENCSGLSLSAMEEDSFTLHSLFGKMVNLAGDLSYTELKKTGNFKMVTGRDMIQSRRKFLPDLKFYNYSKLVFACNELPRVYEPTNAFFRRWILFEFPYKFLSEEEINKLPEDKKQFAKLRKLDIVQQISTPEEMSGLLNKALDGLERILKNKMFSYSKGTEEVRMLWIRRSDSFMAFCLDFIEESIEGRVSKKELRRQYSAYCREHKLRGMGDKPIKITLETLFGASEYQSFTQDDRERYWDGIKFKELKPEVQKL